MKGFGNQKQVAEFLGMSVRYVQNIPSVGANALPYYRIGRCARYKWEDVEKWMQRHKARVNLVW